ncbi:TIGR00341 family protein [Antarcticibacterium flavum]|uniref:TIGR00341 family protein n=1 Tax=Antarcticibacterium flavum TaxID=2058175 RepID=A0A5B7X2B3_9FLAO|nr:MULTISPECIES: TIGR00341 family protein [Antarcticibacterium]MCM4160783.1 TIGR00341 family protein [Antarcticibacterium sp. W02-3]QCY68743.1 TIGR00341 family protein [Antarcticibacterium flavum]
MYYILHHPEDLEKVENNVLPLLANFNSTLVEFPIVKEFSPEEDATFITYLDDEFLRQFLVLAAKENWPVGVLPHPGNKYTIKGLGISGNLEEAVTEVLESKETHNLDILRCNGTPVFQSVNIGDVFALQEDNVNNNFTGEVLTFLRNIRKLPSLTHKSFLLSAEGEKVIHTSALGLIIVEHPLSSVVSKRLISKSAMNDGMFHVLILSPQNIFELLWFLLRSLIPNGKTMTVLPSFIGQLKTSQLKIEDKQEIDYTVDGIPQKAQEIVLEIEHEALILKQASIYTTKTEGADVKKSFKTGRLPTGQKRDELTKRKLPFLPRATTEEFEDLFKVLKENSNLSAPYIIMMVLSTLIATFGLFANSSPVIIGAMILAPIITPIVAFSMGMVRYDIRMLKTGITTILVGTIVSLLFAAGVTLMIPLKLLTSEIDARLSPTLLDMGIAVASGVAAAYAHAEEGIAKSLAGVAIAVALVPPLAVAGIGIGWWDWEVFSGAFLLYLTNLAGIIMFAGITFLILGFAPFRRAKMGLIYTLVIIILVMVPLSLSFERITQEARITRQLEGSQIEQVFLKDVKVRFGKRLVVSLRLVSTDAIEPEDMQTIKTRIEEKIGQPITLEVVSAMEF